MQLLSRWFAISPFTLPLGIGIYTSWRLTFRYSGSPLPRISCKWSLLGIRGRGAGGCEVIGWSLAWINTQGLEQNSGELLHQHLERLRDDRCELSDRMQEKLVAFVTSSASQLQSGERSWLSSESLESAFGLLKRREGQQSRSGFTGLITTLPALLRTWSAGEVRSALRRTSTKKLNEWVAKNVGATLWSRRARAFKHFGERKCHVFATL